MKQRISIISSVVLAIGLVVCAVLFAQKSGDDGRYTTAELAAFDGKNGAKCYVAVDGVVYEIEQGRLWKDGQHTTSQGQAECGKDLTETIGKSPHGKAKLKTLPEVGKFAK